MSVAFADRVQETTATTGTGTVTLAGAVAGFQAFSSAFSTGATVYYCITSGSLWEVGSGVYTTSGTTLTRPSGNVLAGSSGASTLITLAGTSNVFNVIPAAFASGVYYQTTLLTSASANFTTGPNTTKIKIRGVAGGGAGGGTTTSSYQVGGGGGAGSYAEKTFAVLPSTAYAYTCGAGGTGVSGGTGNSGANSTFVVGATTVTCNGGIGAAAGSPYAIGAAGGAVSTNGDVNVAGAAGIVGFSGGPFLSGQGANSQFGGGGIPIYLTVNGTSAVGNNATGYGAGGSGACVHNDPSNARVGGNGSNGCWIVDEYL